MTAAKPKYAEGTFDIEVPGPLATLDDERTSQLLDALAGEAKVKVSSLGPLEVVSREGDIGGVQTVKVKAEIDPPKPAESTEE